MPDAPALLKGVARDVEGHAQGEGLARLDLLGLAHVAAAIGEIEEAIGDEMRGCLVEARLIAGKIVIAAHSPHELVSSISVSRTRGLALE